jgi:tetratricopeptide (TPR) repeat protein
LTEKRIEDLIDLPLMTNPYKLAVMRILSGVASAVYKFYLVEAERYRVLGCKCEAMDYYDRAIELAKANEYINEEALAHELAAKFYLSLGKAKIAQSYMLDARYCYLQWGAIAKVKDNEDFD